jgi:hypothetical protein
LLFEYGISGKLLELLRKIAPRVTRAAVIRDPADSAATDQFGAVPALNRGAAPIALHRHLDRKIGQIPPKIFGRPLVSKCGTDN